MSNVVTAIAELPTEALADWREWVEANGGKVLTPRYLTEGEKRMDANTYQRLAARTINPALTQDTQMYHALHGMVGEVGEIHSIFQKYYQGHDVTEEHLKKEVGDLLWMIAEFCTSFGWNLSEVMELNIAKLKARYPEGFDVEHSIHRAEGDI